VSADPRRYNKSFFMDKSRETVPLTVGRLDLATVKVSADPRRYNNRFFMDKSRETVPLTVGRLDLATG
jgi:hypothetical protein